MGLDDDHLHGHGRPQHVDHLLVGQSGHGHRADLHEAAPLAQASLPGKAERFHVCNDSFKIHVEAKLAQSIPPQGHFHGLAASGHYLRGQETVREGCSGGQNVREVVSARSALACGHPGQPLGPLS